MSVMRDHHFPGRSPVMSTGAMVTTSQPMATQAALQVLYDGGNAMDAAIAASAVLGVVESYSTGIGGDCFILYHEAATGKLHALNGSGRSPAKATLEVVKSQGHETMPVEGMLSVTVPGAIDAWAKANGALGKLDFSRLLQPAIDYAEQGYVVSPVIAKNWQETEGLLSKTPEAAAVYLVDGKAPKAGSVHKQPNLAATMRLIAEQGRDAFYKGAIAKEVIRFSDANGGLFTLDDFANHTSEWVEPISSDYRGYKVCEVPPNGQGITTLMALNILSQTNVGELEHLGAEHINLLSEAFTLAMAERDRYISDPDFNELPVDWLLSDEFAQQQYARIQPHKALNQPVTSALPRHEDTVYISVVDKDRNACSLINSVFHSWGSGLVAGSTGINLQNRGAGFVLEEGHFNQLEPNKLPMHTIIPAMVYKDDQPVLSFGVMGGQYQAMGQAYVLSNWLDYDMDIQQAIDAPRFMLYDGELALEPTVPNDSYEQLQKYGHKMAWTTSPHGGGQGIVIDWENGVLQGGSDPRKDGHAVGY